MGCEDDTLYIKTGIVEIFLHHSVVFSLPKHSGTCAMFKNSVIPCFKENMSFKREQEITSISRLSCFHEKIYLVEA